MWNPYWIYHFQLYFIHRHTRTASLFLIKLIWLYAPPKVIQFIAFVINMLTFYVIRSAYSCLFQKLVSILSESPRRIRESNFYFVLLFFCFPRKCRFFEKWYHNFMVWHFLTRYVKYFHCFKMCALENGIYVTEMWEMFSKNASFRTANIEYVVAGVLFIIIITFWFHLNENAAVYCGMDIASL